MNMSVLYEPDGEYGRLLPVWVMLDNISLDWNGALYIQLEAPFERYTFDDLDTEVMALAVPDHAYIRHREDPFQVGVHLPTLQSFITKSTLGTGQSIECSDIERLMLRISDIEDTLQCEVRSCLQWGSY